MPAGRRRWLEQRASQGARGLPAAVLVPRPARLRGSHHRPALPPAGAAAGARRNDRAEPAGHQLRDRRALGLAGRAGQVPDSIFEPERFESDPQYAANLGRFNLLTYLVEHQDGRAGNFLVSEEPEDRRVFAVDNGIAFDAPVKNCVRPQLERDPHPRPSPPRDRTAAQGRARSDRPARRGGRAAAPIRTGCSRSCTPGPNRTPKVGGARSRRLAPARPHALGARRPRGTPARPARARRSRRAAPLLSVAARARSGDRTLELRPSQPSESRALIELAEGTGVFKPIEIQALEEVLSDYHAHERANGHRCTTAWPRGQPDRLRVLGPRRDDRPHLAPLVDRGATAICSRAGSGPTCSPTAKPRCAPPAGACC